MRTSFKRSCWSLLRDAYGVDISDEAVRRAVEDHNEISSIITEIGNLKAAEPAPYRL